MADDGPTSPADSPAYQHADDDGTPTLFVHSLYGRGRAEILEGLRDMESRLLKVTRPGGHDRTDRSPEGGRS